MFDPFNVQVIQDKIYKFNDDETFDPVHRIIKALHPAIDFYDFAKGEMLLKKYNKLKKENNKLLKEIREHRPNELFLSETKRAGITVSNNLDGTVLEDGVTFYPAKQNISKDDVFEVQYKKSGQGVVLVESYFNNPRNAHRIKVNLNGEQFDINEFLN